MNEHRAKICRSHFVGREAGDELLRLQATYARAYTVLQNHEHDCPDVNWCQGLSDVILKTIRMPSPTANRTSEPCPSPEGPILRPVGRTQDIRGRHLFTEGDARPLLFSRALESEPG
jgi:hypothetical protein